ncbi:hypothetical protein OG949_34105 [Streptomyces scopuliridis]|nr:hypothetical protein OG949_34105 [Streptomyces scopuliridis]
MVETPSRASAGAHYTPRSLAEEVVRYALEPLVYAPGPHQTANQDAWRPLDSDQILELRIADIACGSGAFLVAAARYLADRLVEAWQREGVAYGRAPHDLLVHAIRTVVATCLYGADINGMAVEMCKLSLWLVSLDPKLPFSFVDDKVLHGNALLGLTDADQLRRLHIHPAAAGNQLSVFALDVDDILDQATRLRRQLASEVDDNDPQRSAATKRRQWRRYQELTEQLADVADGVIAAGLQGGGKPGKQLKAAYENLRIAVESAYPAGGEETDRDRTMLDGIQEAGLSPTVTTDYRRWKPLHWILAVPDVMERGGFNAIVGNPPFLGEYKIPKSMGSNVRSWLVETIAFGRKGKSDLVAYFFLRAMALAKARGTLGLIATSSVGEGQTREVGLDQMTQKGFTIARAIQSKPWPTTNADLEYAAVWGTCADIPDTVPRIVDSVEAKRISTVLEPMGRVDDYRVKLATNRGIAFKGCEPYGGWFIVSPEQALEWIESEANNSRVLKPFLGGDDLNSRPDGKPSRWAIDFTGLSEEDARAYTLPYGHVLEHVKPDRAKKAKAVREAPWWLFHRPRPALRAAISSQKEMLAITRHSKTALPLRIPTSWLPSDATIAFATDSFEDQAVLSSSLHQVWAIKFGSGMRNDPRYTPSSVFETFPFPSGNKQLTEVGKALELERREIMTRRRLGLTDLYSLVNDHVITDQADADVAKIREIHTEIDRTVVEAYGWDDVPLGHGFHTYRQMERWMVSPIARVEILDRLLEENHRRAASQGDIAPPDHNSEGDEEEDDE